MTDEFLSDQTIASSEPQRFLTQKTFESFNLPEKVLAGIRDAGFTHCTPIQARVLPVALEGRDVAGQAQTGTGKTAAFLVTIFSRLDESRFLPGLPSALIVAPTRELALQIYNEAKMVGGHTGLKLALVVGGIDYQKQAQTLKAGVDIVICTPGRLIDYMKQGIFKPDAIQIVVVDEADRLLDLGFAKDMRFILKKLPSYEKRQSLLFSATLSFRVLELTYEYMNLPEFIDVSPDEVTVKGIEQALIHVGMEEKLKLLLGILKREEWERLLIFVNTKAEVERLTRKLKGNGWPAQGITGDVPQRTRLALMEAFKSGKTKILVATDVASRGIHVEDISHVINYDLPQDAENYVHRIGRTARAGKTGKAISLACEKFVYHLEPIEEILGYKIPVLWPEDDWFVKDEAGPVRIEGGRPKRPRKERPKPEKHSEPKPEKRSEAKAEKRSEPKPEKRSEAKPEKRSEPKPEKRSEAKPEKRSEPKPAAQELPEAALEEAVEQPAIQEPAKKPRAAAKTAEKRKPAARGKGIAMSSQPGGIFGLAPLSFPASEEEGAKPAAAKKPRKKSRRKRKPAAEGESKAETPTTAPAEPAE
ncbi:DEAD/DEAH box helicase [Desulfatiglans anilini]|uniref:DEAD/DEAH box helicase n=1 Tax=Desulfatiglans anilini TaxID=90728 RepID=UPI00040606F5|nr:DEAD/DEAH box helicase [Desulfatiglans anilini]